jgi:hypothetical protein
MSSDKRRKKCTTKSMMENSDSLEGIFHRRRQRWLQYGRALLTIGVLGLITIALYAMTHTNAANASAISGAIVSEESLRFIDDEVAWRRSGSEQQRDENNNSDDIAISYKVDNKLEVVSERVIVKRAVDPSHKTSNVIDGDDKMPKNSREASSSEIRQQNLSKDESDNELGMDSQHQKMFRRQQSNDNNVVHRHSDNKAYVFSANGYKCVPISQPQQQQRMRLNRKPTKQLGYVRARQRVGMCVCICALPC